MNVVPERVPESLRRVPQWVCYVLARKPGKSKDDKIPVHPRTGQWHDGQDKAIWMDFERALEVMATKGYSGVGFVVTADDPFTGIDLDNCLSEAGEVEPWAEPIVYCFQSYTEKTPSGRGLRILIRGSLPGSAGHRTNGLGPDGAGAIEVYDSLRFFTVTGLHIEGTPLEVHERQEELDAFARARLTRPADPDRPSATPTPNGVSDEDILSMARRYWPGEKFGRLFDDAELTDYAGNWSQADMALCNFLAFWAGGDARTVDRLFRKSALM